MDKGKLSNWGLFFNHVLKNIPGFQMLDTLKQRFIFGPLTGVEAHKKASGDNFTSPRGFFFNHVVENIPDFPRGFLVTLKRL